MVESNSLSLNWDDFQLGDLTQTLVGLFYEREADSHETLSQLGLTNEANIINVVEVAQLSLDRTDASLV